MKKKNFTKYSVGHLVAIRIAIVMIILAGVIIYASRNDITSMFTKPVDICGDDFEVSKLKKGLGVDTEICCALDCSSYLETTRKQNGATTGKTYDYFYIIPIFDKDVDKDERYILLKVGQEDKKLLDTMTDEFWAYLSGEAEYYGYTTYQIRGTLRKADKEAYKYMKEWFEEAEWFEDDSQIDELVLPLVLQVYSADTMRVIFIIAVVMLLLGILIIVLAIASARKNADKEENISTTYDDSSLNSNNE